AGGRGRARGPRAAGGRGRAAERPAEAARRPFASVRLESAGALRHQTASARRFREFLNPQSFAVAGNEELRSPRLLAAHFSGQITDPEIAHPDAPAPAAANAPA